jgi:hypothetical protein
MSSGLYVSSAPADGLEDSIAIGGSNLDAATASRFLSKAEANALEGGLDWDKEATPETAATK